MSALLALQLCLGLAAAGDVTQAPTVQVSWKKGQGRLEVVPPKGTYVQHAAPVSGWWELGPTRTELRATGAELADGLALDLPLDQRGLRGQLSVPICDEGGTTCRMVDVGFAGKLAGPKGKALVLAPWAPKPEVEEAPAPHLDLDAAFAASKADGKPVLLDFGAVWCPPCNRMSAEVLDDPADAALLEAFHVAAVDVDKVESWPVKSRYAVGGYPTVVAVKADGSEVDRYLGYVSEADFKAWLGGVKGVAPLSALPAPETLSGPEAAAVALRLAKVEKKLEAGPYLLRAAEQGEQGLAWHEARVLVLPELGDVRWLLEHDAPDLLTWIWSALEVGGKDPATRALLLRAVRKAAAGADAIELSDLLYCVGQLTEGEESTAAYLLSAQTLTNGLSGDAALDRGHWAGLAQLWEEAGLPDRGEAVLLDAIAAYPDEFTFHHGLARLRLRMGQDAISAAQAAREHAYGDNALRAVETLAMALNARGRTDEALALIDETLARAVRPGEDVKVRTPRYLEALEKTRATIVETAE